MKQTFQTYFPRVALAGIAAVLVGAILALVLLRTPPTEDATPTVAALNSLEQAQNGVSMLLRSAEDGYFAADYFPTLLGAAGDGRRDDTEEIQQALELAAAKGGGTVYLPAGTYRLTRPLKVESHVVLRGDYAPESARQQENARTVLLATDTPELREAPLFTLEENAELRGIAIFYEGQSPQNPIPFPETLRCAGNNTLWDLTLFNSVQGIAAKGATGLQIENVLISALKQGIGLSDCADISLRRVRISPVSWLNQDPGATEWAAELSARLKEEFVGIALSRVQTAALSQVQISTAARGLLLEGAGADAIRLTALNISDAVLPIAVDALPTEGLLLSGCTFSAADGTADTCAALGEGVHSPVIFTSCVFSGRARTAIKAQSDTLLSLSYCSFGSLWNWLESEGDTFLSVRSHFSGDAAQVQLGENALGLLYGQSAVKESDTLLFSMDETLSPVEPWADDTNKTTVQTAALPVFSAREYGVSPDKEDNTEPLNRALQTAAAAGGGIVFVEEGEYRFLTPIPVPQNVILAGVSGKQGSYTTRLLFPHLPYDYFVELRDGAGLWDLTVAADGETDCAGIMAQEGPVALHGAATEGVRCGVFLQNIQEARLTHCRLEATDTALRATKVEKLSLSGCELEGQQTALELIEVTDARTEFCRFVGGAAGILLPAGEEGATASSLRGEGLTIQAEVDGVRIGAGERVILTDSHISAATGGCVYAQETNHGTVTLQSLCLSGAPACPLTADGGKATVLAALFPVSSAAGFFHAGTGGELTICGSVFAAHDGVCGVAADGSVSLIADLLASQLPFEGVGAEYFTIDRTEGSQAAQAGCIIKYHAVPDVETESGGENAE